MAAGDRRAQELSRIYKKPEDYELAGQGNAYRRIDAQDKVTGRAVYTGDIRLPGMLTGRIKRSPYARAKIIRIDPSAALAFPGVKCVITGRDFPPGSRTGYYEALRNQAYKSPLCTENVCMWGDEVAAVAAVDEETAEQALDLIQVEYQVLEPVLEASEALKEEAPLVHDLAAGNISSRTFTRAGDVKTAFARASHKESASYRTQMAVHGAIEPHGAVAAFENGEYTLWTGTQNAYVCRYWVAEGLGVPETCVRVIKPLVGGSFGGKLDTFPHQLCACRMAAITGRPVKIMLDRREVFCATRVRHPMEIDIETAFSKEGRLLAKRCVHTLDGGAYGGSGEGADALSLVWDNLPYKAPAVDLTARRVYTDKPVGGPMRGFTACQVHFANDVHMEQAAKKLGIDALALRRINGCTPGYETPVSLKVTSCAFDETLVRASDAVRWEQRKGGEGMEPGEGVGLSGSAFLSGTGLPVLLKHSHSQGSTTVRLNRDGFATVFTGADDMGQGSDTLITMIVAEELGLKMNEVKCVVSDTALAGCDAGSSGSRVTFLAGNAARRAVGDAKLQLLGAVAESWGCSPENITVKGHRVYIKGSSEKDISYNEAVALYEEANGGRCIVGIGSGSEDGRDEVYETNQKKASISCSFSSGACRVKVDRETGSVEIPEFYLAHDCGRPLNILACEGQIEGSVEQGLGFACYEECLFDSQGRMTNPSFCNYRFPTALDMPMVTTFFCGQPDPEGPFGAKEAGEGSTAPVAPAIVNAINRACGVVIRELPVTPEKLWRALREQDEDGGAADGEAESQAGPRIQIGGAKP